jgi:hypothetical protein
MRRFPYGLLSSIISPFILLAGGVGGTYTDMLIAEKQASWGKPSFRLRSGRTYPHSSTRQRARYARQIAAGQLRMEGC